MLNCRAGFAIGFLTLVLASCGTEPVTRTVYVTPDVPEALRQPVTVPDRRAETLQDVGLILADHVEGLETANGRIASIDDILTRAECQADPQRCEGET